jgi:uroporphyrin-III C-methyltransferase
MTPIIAAASGEAPHEEHRAMTAWDALAARRAGVPVFAPGHVWLAGAGPGLLTLDALAGLTQADVIVHDALVDERVLALAGPQARLEFAGKRGGKPSATQTDISERLVALARAGKRVLRLKGGDPFVFGRGGEEAMTLAAAGVPYRVIPGVTAGLGALAAAAIPATLRGINRAVIFAAGHGADEDFDWAPLVRTGQPIVLYMVMHNLERTTAALMQAGLAAETPAAVIASATTPKQRVLVSTLEKLAADAREQKFEPPAIVVIGDIVEMRTRLLGEDAFNVKETEWQ